MNYLTLKLGTWACTPGAHFSGRPRAAVPFGLAVAAFGASAPRDPSPHGSRRWASSSAGASCAGVGQRRSRPPSCETRPTPPPSRRMHLSGRPGPSGGRGRRSAGRRATCAPRTRKPGRGPHLRGRGARRAHRGGPPRRPRHTVVGDAPVDVLGAGLPGAAAGGFRLSSPSPGSARADRARSTPPSGGLR